MNRFQASEQFRYTYLNKTYEKLVSGKIGSINPPFFTARIPIIRMFSKRKLQVDIQFGNIGPIRSSLFIRTCVEYDERVRLLIHWLTNKFQESEILKNRFFSRYHINVLVVHFLQAIPYPVLPDIINLSPWLSKKNDWNNAVKVLTRQGSLYVPNCNEVPNEQSVGGLAVQLIDYYSQIDFRKFAIDTRGHVFERTDNDPLFFKISDEYFEQPTCNVMEAPRLLSKLFSELKSKVKSGNYEDVFNYHVQIKKAKSSESIA
uniref:DUF4238 domain-containing protein n=1 Tax=Caenorhabditis tropicalis TaxID=1561998 RepID=A0A1I7UVU0_9PELO